MKRMWQWVVSRFKPRPSFEEYFDKMAAEKKPLGRTHALYRGRWLPAAVADDLSRRESEQRYSRKSLNLRNPWG